MARAGIETIAPSARCQKVKVTEGINARQFD